MFVGVLKAGPDAVALNSSFKNRYTDKNFSHSLKHSDVKSVVFVVVLRSQGHYTVRDRVVLEVKNEEKYIRASNISILC